MARSKTVSPKPAKKKAATVRATTTVPAKRAHPSPPRHMATPALSRTEGSGATRSTVNAVRAGLSLHSLEALRARLAPMRDEVFLRLLGLSVRTYQRRKEKGEGLSSLESDRLYRLEAVIKRAIDVFGDETLGIRWLKTTNRVLGEAPIALLDTQPGVEMVERVLTRIEHGVVS